MWTEVQKNGKFKYVERYKHPLTGEDKKVSLTHTKKNARVEKEMFLKLQEKIEKKIEEHTQSVATVKNATFEELSEDYMKVYKKRVRESTYKVNEGRLNTINRVVGNAQLDHLTAVAFNKFLLEEFDKGYTYESVNSKKKLIVQILSFGIEYGYISDRSLPDSIKIQRLNISEKQDWKYLERYELDKIIKFFEENGMHEESRLCQIQAATGMRFNEMAALDYRKHIDFKNKIINIERSYDKENKIYTLPKNNKKRTIHIKDSTLQLIKEQIQHDQLKMMSQKLDRNNTLLFRTKFDNPYPLKAMNKKLKRIELDSGKELTTHIFRHTFITLMVEAGIEPKLIAEHVGHADTKMIDQVYSHFTETMDDKMKQAILNVDIV